MNKPYIDISNLAFASEEEQREAMERYTDELTEYIKEQLSPKKKRKSLSKHHLSVIAIAVYTITIILQLCFFTPSTRYSTFLSSQGVPHKVTELTTYGAIWEAESASTNLNALKNKPVITGYELNLSRFIWQLIFVTFIYAVLCYIAYISFTKNKSQEELIKQHSNAPAIEVNSYPEFENGHQFSILDYEQQRDYKGANL